MTENYVADQIRGKIRHPLTMRRWKPVSIAQAFCLKMSKNKVGLRRMYAPFGRSCFTACLMTQLKASHSI